MKIKAIALTGLLAMSAYTIYNIPEPPKQSPTAQQQMQQQSKDSKKIPQTFPMEKKVNPFVTHPEIPLSPELQRFTRAIANEHGVPYIIVLAVMEQESRFDVNADSGDSVGIMQIHTVYGPREKIMNPYQNIRIGCRLLGYLYSEYHDWNKALVAYNCGEAGAYEMYFRHGSISSPYSREVMFRTEKFAKLLGEESVLRPKK